MQNIMKKENEIFLERQEDQDPCVFLLSCDKAPLSQVTGRWQTLCI